MEYYKISDFAAKIGKHTNTVDGWFKKLEQQQVHYVNRVENEKVYDELDLKIGLFIDQKRADGWALRAIFNVLDDHFELRSFPEDMPGNVPLDLEVVRKKFSEDLRLALEEEQKPTLERLEHLEKAVFGVIDQVQNLVKQLPRTEDIVTLLPTPSDPIVERQQRITEMITLERIRGQLRKEALHMWSTKPEEERMKRTGLFGLKKEEDHAARDRFVQGYIDDHLPERLAQEYGMNKA